MKRLGTIKSTTFQTTKRKKKSTKEFTIIFETDEQVNPSSMFTVLYDGKRRPFKVKDISVNEDSKYEVRAKETGYFADRPSHNRDLDIKELMGLDVYLITNRQRISDIKKESFYC